MEEENNFTAEPHPAVHLSSVITDIHKFTKQINTKEKVHLCSQAVVPVFYKMDVKATLDPSSFIQSQFTQLSYELLPALREDFSVDRKKKANLLYYT